jgi:spore coat polysaccharide biosynthesis protein SpsF
MSSSRLPGKVLAPVVGQPMILRQIERLRRSARLDELVVATSVDPTDDALCEVLGEAGVIAVRGPLADVLARFIGVLDLYPQTRVLCRLTADCPLTDWRVLDQLIDRHLETSADYGSDSLPVRTYPHGLDVETASPEALRRAAAESASPYDHEHVTPFLYAPENGFRIASVSRSPPLDHLRWTVDYPEDLDFVRHVYETLYPAKPAFLSEDIVALPWNSSRAPV